MPFRITRHDGLEDELTNQEFDTFDQAYDLLEEIYRDVCCSDADYDDRPYYEIIEFDDWTLSLKAFATSLNNDNLKFILRI